MKAKNNLGGVIENSFEVSNLAVNFGSFQALHNINLKIPKGQQSVIIGPNGAGKSTLVKAILGFISYKGQVKLNCLKTEIAYIPQFLEFERNLPLTVLELMALSLNKRPLFLACAKKTKEKAFYYLSVVKAEHLLNRALGELSGGELQRVLLSSSLALKPKVLLLDEPTTGVDVYGEELLCEVLENLKGEFTTIMVSHNLAMAKAHANWVICLNRTVVAQGEPQEVFTKDIISKTFGLHYFESVTS